MIHVLQLIAGQLGGQVAGQQLHAHHTVHGAVVQDEGLHIGQRVPVVPFQAERCRSPAAIVIRRKLALGGIGDLERFLVKAGFPARLVWHGRRPALIRGDAQRGKRCCGAPFCQQVGVPVGGKSTGVQVADVKAGQIAVIGPVAQVVSAQNDKDAIDRLCPQGAHQLRDNGLEQRQGFLTGGIQRVQIHDALVHQFPRHAVNGTADGIEVLRLDQVLAQVIGAVLHLLVENILGILIQLAGHPAGADGKDQQQHFCQKHQQQGAQDLAKDRAAPPLIRCLFFHPCFPLLSAP